MHVTTRSQRPMSVTFCLRLQFYFEKSLSLLGILQLYKSTTNTGHGEKNGHRQRASRMLRVAHMMTIQLASLTERMQCRRPICENRSVRVYQKSMKAWHTRIFLSGYSAACCHQCTMYIKMLNELNQIEIRCYYYHFIKRNTT